MAEIVTTGADERCRALDVAIGRNLAPLKKTLSAHLPRPDG
jgi:hypothetical protein